MCFKKIYKKHNKSEKRAEKSTFWAPEYPWSKKAKKTSFLTIFAFFTEGQLSKVDFCLFA